MTTDIETVEREQSIVTTTQTALGITITNAATYEQAGGMLCAFKDLEKQIHQYFKPLKESAHKSWKGICQRENEEIDKLRPGLEHLSKELMRWNFEQDQKRREEENRLRAEALKAEEERRLQEALQAESEGNKDEAVAILEETVYIPPPVVESTVPKISGMTMRETWDFEVTDINLIPREYMLVNETAIRAIVGRLKGQARIPGIRAFKKSSVVRTGR